MVGSVPGYPVYTDIFDGRFNGKIDTHPDRLSIPQKRRKPTVFAIWNDWCHERVNHVFRHKMVISAEFSEQHTVLALTKRPHVMLDFWKSGIQHVPANWWNGLTVCNQAEADSKIPEFLKVPGKKFLSIEPQLGPVDLIKKPAAYTWEYAIKTGYYWGLDQRSGGSLSLDAVILGGETGPGARPMHPDWVRSVRDQCAAAGVQFFFKGWGKYIPTYLLSDGLKLPAKRYCWVAVNDGSVDYGIATPFTNHFHHALMASVGYLVSDSRLLDGRTHDDLPWVTV